MKKRVFLLSKAEEYETEIIPVTSYNYIQHINLTYDRERSIPTVLMESSGPTHSKTMKWPSDDDPDDDLCY